MSDGLLGLTKSINTKESALTELSVLERMDQRVQKDRDAEVAAQKEQQLFYEQMYERADQLLEKDRVAMNKKIMRSQNMIQQEISKYGGSIKHFRENGGVNITNTIKNNILKSDEAVRYEENKKNLARIFEAQSKGLGHLLSPKDLKSVEDYNNNEEGGRITFSGMMSEVEIPPSANFDYGTDIPLEKIMSYKGNMMKILNNYKIVYPDDTEITHAKLAVFAKQMGYGGQGSNTTAIRLKAQQAQKAKQYKNQTSTKNNRVSYLANWNAAISRIDKSVTTKDFAEGGKYSKGMIQALKNENKNSVFNQMLAQKSNLYSKDRRNSNPYDISDSNNIGIVKAPLYVVEAIGESIDWAFNNQVGLKDSYEFMPASSSKISKRILTDEMQYEIKDGQVLNFVPDEKIYMANGTKMAGKNKPLDFQDYKGNYKIKGVVSALKTTAGDGGEENEVLMVNYYNDDGSLDEETTKTSDEALAGQKGGSGVKMTTVIALENENGDLFYREVPLDRIDIRNAVANSIGEEDDITEQVNIEARQKQAFDDLDDIDTKQQIQFESAIKSTEETFEVPTFKSEAEQYWGAGGGGQLNRNELMKSFYMAADYVNQKYSDPNTEPEVNHDQIEYLMNNNFFTRAAVDGNIEESLKDYSQGNDERDIIMNWLDNTASNNELEKGTLNYKRNAELAQKWLQMLELFNQ